MAAELPDELGVPLVSGHAQLGFPQLTILRPSLLDDEGARAERRLGERLALPLGRALFSVVGATHRYARISADAIARALVRLAFDEMSERESWRVIGSMSSHVRVDPLDWATSNTLRCR